VTLSCWITQYCHCETSEPATAREPCVTYGMALVTDLDDILLRTPSLVAGKAFEYRLQSGLVEIDQHRHVVNFPLNKVAVVEATSVSEC
jgi:hypothetical protein